MRDIFANADSFDICDIANYFNIRLTDNICFEDRTERIEYKHVLHEKDYVKHLQRWLKRFNIHYFEFIDPEEDEEIDMKEYMKWDDWWVKFEELRKLIDEQYEKCLSEAKRWEEEDVRHDMDRLAELAYEED